MTDCIFISNLYPNPVETGKGQYNRDQIAALTKLGLKVLVLSPVPWFPGINPWQRGIPREAVPQEDGSFATKLPPTSDLRSSAFAEATADMPTSVTYCRQLYLPGSRGAQNGWLYSWSIRRQLSRLIREHQPRFLWSSFAFPDGVGVGMEARRHGLLHVVSLLGSDINLNRQYPTRWRMIMRMLGEAKLIFAKSQALKDAVVEAGVADEKVVIDYNGVDQALFRPVDREQVCGELGIDPAMKRILFVGNLVPVKDVGTLIKAYALLRKTQGPRLKAQGSSEDAAQREAHLELEPCSLSLGTSPLELAIIGSGPEEPRLRKLASDLGLLVPSDLRLPTSDFRLLGRLPRKQVSQWMQACDTVCLPSLNEGVPNVVLEALASGTPVVASRVGGIPEVHPGTDAGALVEAGDVTALSAALRDVLDREWSPRRLRGQVESFTWDANARRVMDALRDV